MRSRLTIPRTIIVIPVCGALESGEASVVSEEDEETKEIQDLMEPKEFLDPQDTMGVVDDKEPRVLLVHLESKEYMAAKDLQDHEGELERMVCQDPQVPQDHPDHQEQQYLTQLLQHKLKDLLATTTLTTTMAIITMADMVRHDRHLLDQL